ncbi:MAG: DUF4476 domain-containing protein [Chitinophagaceae bacterium]|nr:DUF4476 domain-containing protein [Chitinophagaceae bacterium]
MMIRLLANLICTVSLVSFSLGTMAQNNHFIYLQTENSQPFYIRLNGKVISSTPDGYVILPKIQNGNYNLMIGFPRNEFPEKAYPVTISGDNEGFLLKKLDNSWTLFNIETLALTEGKSTQAIQPVVAETKTPEKNNSFTSLLAQVVRDSSLLNNNPGRINADSSQATAMNNSTLADSSGAQNEISAAVVPGNKIENNPATAKNVLVPEQESSSPEGQLRGDVTNSKAADSKAARAINDSTAMVVNDKQGTAGEKAESFKIMKKELPLKHTDSANATAQFQIVSNNPKTSADSASQLVSDNVILEGNPQTVQPAVKRILLVNEANGLDLIYVDRKLKDTVRLFMPVINRKPVEKPTARVIYEPSPKDTSLTITPTIVKAPATGNQYTPQPAQKPETDSVAAQEPTNQLVQTKTLISAKDTLEQTNSPAQQKSDEQIVAVLKDSAVKKDTTAAQEKLGRVIYNPNTNSDCKNFATEDDFSKLWKKMLTEVGDEKMIETARKFFRKKCYSVDQVRELSKVFLYDKGKYEFFDAAYPFTSDSNRYYVLESELHDPYYINRFKAMITR